MTGLAQLLAFLALLCLIAKPLGSYIADVFEGKPTFGSRILRPLERLIYIATGVSPDVEQRWTTYSGACIAFSLAGFLLFYFLLRWQAHLPFNPQRFSTAAAPAGATPMTPDLAFNTAISFMTNTSWQSYAGEATLSYFSQMAGVCVQSFASAAAGIAVAIALIRGFARPSF